MFSKRKSGRYLLEAFKFSLCLFLPLAASTIYADPKVMHSLVRKYSFVKYPEAEIFESTQDDIKKLRDKLGSNIEKP